MTNFISAIAGEKSRQFTVSIDTVFDFYKPKPPLSRFVTSIWIFSGSDAEHKIERILPTGTLELAINLRENKLGFCDARLSETCRRFSGAVVSGAHGHSFAPDPEEEAFIIGVHFKPGGAFPFLGLPAGDLADTHVDLETLWGASAVRLRERLCETKTSAGRFRLLEAALIDRLYRRGTEQHCAVPAALEMFGKNQIAPSVRDAAKHVGLSQRRFIQIFKAEVGLTPKLYSRIHRFQRTRAFIERNPSPDWATLALDFGYFDQSHFIREFIEFSGVGPTRYLKQRKTLASLDKFSKSNSFTRF